MQRTSFDPLRHVFLEFDLLEQPLKLFTSLSTRSIPLISVSSLSLSLSLSQRVVIDVPSPAGKMGNLRTDFENSFLKYL